MRFFNTTGPVVAADHYCIPPLERLNLPQVRRLLRDKRDFVLHAPRQTDKSLEQTIAEGLEQTAEYMDRCAAEAGHLVIFDRRTGRRQAKSGVEIDVWGM